MTTHTATELTSPHDLLAAVPFMVGYHPKDSLVVMALKESKVAMAMRVDFPDSENMASVSATIAGHLTRESADEAIIVGYLPSDDLDTDPLAVARSIITLQGIAVKECIVVSGGRFRSNLCADAQCCPPEGNPVPEILDSRVTAEQVAAGNPLPYLDLDEMKRSIAALPVDKELVRIIKSIPEIDYSGEDVTQLQRAGANAINEMAIVFSRAQRIEDKNLIALVLVRLLDLQVRDYAMGMTTAETSDQLWDMWRWLMRTAPVGYVAPVAVILSLIHI